MTALLGDYGGENGELINSSNLWNCIICAKVGETVPVYDSHINATV